MLYTISKLPDLCSRLEVLNQMETDVVCENFVVFGCG